MSKEIEGVWKLMKMSYDKGLLDVITKEIGDSLESKEIEEDLGEKLDDVDIARADKIWRRMGIPIRFLATKLMLKVLGFILKLKVAKRTVGWMIRKMV